MLNPAKDDEWYDPEKVKEFMGVRPDQVADLLALKGDAIDNIPGAPGIGDKGARDLIERFGSVEAALERAAEVERKMYRESLQNNVERIRMSKRLATIATDVPIDFDAESVKAQPPDAAALKAVYKELEFHSLLKELGPGEDTRTRDYRRHRRTRRAGGVAGGNAGGDRPSPWPSRNRRRASSRSIPSGWRGGRARRARCTSENLPYLKPWLEDAGAAEDRLRREIGAAGAGPHGHRGARLRARRDAVRVPAGCRPLGLPAGRAGAAAAGSEAGSVARAARRYHARDLAAALRRRWTRAACASCTPTIELPLARVLARMERTGVRIDPVELKRLSGLMETRDRAADGRDPRAGGQAVQHQLAAAVGAGAVRRSEPAGAGEVRQGQDHLHRGGRAGGTGGRITRSCARCWNTGSSPS